MCLPFDVAKDNMRKSKSECTVSSNDRGHLPIKCCERGRSDTQYQPHLNPYPSYAINK